MKATQLNSTQTGGQAGRYCQKNEFSVKATYLFSTYGQAFIKTAEVALLFPKQLRDARPADSRSRSAQTLQTGGGAQDATLSLSSNS